MAGLSPRQGAVLRAVVEQYVSTAIPVASEGLARHVTPPVSSATIRNDLAVLESEGLVFQPHTSSGRVPSDQGYRFFVEHLLPDRGLTAQERRAIRQQFFQAESEVSDWLRLACSALASACGAAAIVTDAAPAVARLRHFEVLPFDGNRLLLIAVTHDSAVLRRLVEWLDPVDFEVVRGHNALLNTTWLNFAANELQVYDLPETIRGAFWLAIRDALAGLLARHDGEHWHVRWHDGLANVLTQPEFSTVNSVQGGPARLRNLVAIVEHGDAVRDVLPNVVQRGVLQVLIGEEQPAALRDYSLVLCPFGSGLRGSGVLGLIGPTRIDYPRAINGTRFIAGILTMLMNEWTGGAPQVTT